MEYTIRNDGGENKVVFRDAQTNKYVCVGCNTSTNYASRIPPADAMLKCKHCGKLLKPLTNS